MIGIQCTPEETATAQEFFQLFKTPWEPIVSGQKYDVVISTVDSPISVDTRLLILVGPTLGTWDTRFGFRPSDTVPKAILDLASERLPIYCGLQVFEPVIDGQCRECASANGRTAGLSKELEGRIIVRLGYNLLKEVQYLLTTGQPCEHAAVPTLDLHIDFLRRLILEAGITFVEIPPVPAGCHFAVCLTHDIDFIGIRQHFLDHSMWGFLFRATIGAFLRFLRGKIGFGQLAKCWLSALSLPLVFAGVLKDFWIPFEWYLEVERDLPATYYLIPFKGRPGERGSSKHHRRRATAYDVSDLSAWLPRLQEAGCEIGVHGIDSWHSPELGRLELDRIRTLNGGAKVGIRMHWLLSDDGTPKCLEQAGYDYDSTVGYNETPGYRAGTGQVYRQPSVEAMLELPMHIQDGALFYPQRLGLSEAEAWDRCAQFIRRAQAHGGVLTVLWHDRSHGPERFWGAFYIRLVNELKSLNVWFGTGGQVVDWFRARRSITFTRGASVKEPDRIVANLQGASPARHFVLRVHRPGTLRASSGAALSQLRDETTWSGSSEIDLSILAGASVIHDSASAALGIG